MTVQISAPAAAAGAAARTYRVACRECRCPVDGFVTACPACGALVDALYDLRSVEIGPSGTGCLERFHALLPFDDRAAGRRLSVHPTPLVDLSALFPGVGRVVGKLEGANPTGSTKDGMVAVALAHMAERGVTEFAFSSTGNTSAAFAWGLAQWPELVAHLFRPRGFPVPDAIPPNLLVHEVDGDYAAAQDAAAAFCREHGVTKEGGFASVGRREGSKLAYLHALCELPETPTAIVQAVSSGMGIVAAEKACAELLVLDRIEHLPRLYAVQQETCAPMVASHAAGSRAMRPEDVVADPQGLSVATLLGDASGPYPYVHDAVTRTGGDIVGVPATGQRDGRRVLRGLGIDACYSSSTAFAAVWELARSGAVGPEDVVLVNLTGCSSSLAGRQER